MIEFDEDTFMALSGMKLGDYTRELRDMAFPGLDRQSVARLLELVPRLDDEHAFDVIEFGIHFRSLGLSDIAVEYMRRSSLTGGPIVSMMMMLERAHDLGPQHIEQMEGIQFDPARIPAFEAFTSVFQQEIERLRKKVGENNRNAAGS